MPSIEELYADYSDWLEWLTEKIHDYTQRVEKLEAKKQKKELSATAKKEVATNQPTPPARNVGLDFLDENEPPDVKSLEIEDDVAAEMKSEEGKEEGKEDDTASSQEKSIPAANDDMPDWLNV